DFDLKLGDTAVGFELVEADRSERRRADEYKEAARREAAGLPDKLDGVDPIEERQAAIPPICRGGERKAGKKYRPAPDPLVYVNFSLFDKPPLTAGQFGQLLQPWRASFPEVWLLWGANAIRCWPDPAHLVGAPPEVFP